MKLLVDISTDFFYETNRKATGKNIELNLNYLIEEKKMKKKKKKNIFDETNRWLNEAEMQTFEKGNSSLYSDSFFHFKKSNEKKDEKQIDENTLCSSFFHPNPNPNPNLNSNPKPFSPPLSNNNKKNNLNNNKNNKNNKNENLNNNLNNNQNNNLNNQINNQNCPQLPPINQKNNIGENSFPSINFTSIDHLPPPPPDHLPNQNLNQNYNENSDQFSDEDEENLLDVINQKFDESSINFPNLINLSIQSQNSPIKNKNLNNNNNINNNNNNLNNINNDRDQFIQLADRNLNNLMKENEIQIPDVEDDYLGNDIKDEKEIGENDLFGDDEDDDFDWNIHV